MSGFWLSQLSEVVLLELPDDFPEPDEPDLLLVESDFDELLEFPLEPLDLLE